MRGKRRGGRKEASRIGGVVKVTVGRLVKYITHKGGRLGAFVYNVGGFFFLLRGV